MTKSTSFVLVGSPYTPTAALAALDAAARCACGKPIDQCDANILGQAPMDGGDMEIDADTLHGIFGEVLDSFHDGMRKRRRALRAQSKAEAVETLGRIMEDVAGATLILAELVDEVHNAADSDED